MTDQTGRSGRKVSVSDARMAGAFAEQLDALTKDDGGRAYLVPGQVEIHHVDGWILAVAVYEDDAWWLDFSRYGDDLPPATGSGSNGMEEANGWRDKTA